MECLGAQYYDSLTQLCKTCHNDCRRCTGPGKFSCSACTLPLHLDKLNNQCVPCCPGGIKKNESTECCICDPDTGGCRNSSPAGKRRVPGTDIPSDTIQFDTDFESLKNSDDNINYANTFTISAATVMAVAICVASVALFAAVFVALQAVSRRRDSTIGYTKLAVRVEPRDEIEANDTTELMT